MDDERSRPTRDGPRRRVLFATNGEEPASKAERLILQLADPSGIEVVVACVSTFDMSLEVSERLGLGGYSPEAGLKHAEHVVAEAASRFRESGFQARSHVEEGDAPIQLLSLADREACEVVAVGAGHRRFGQAPVLGRTVRMLLHESDCSVLVVHDVAPEPRQHVVLVGTDGSQGADDALRSFASFADPARSSVIVALAARPSPERFRLGGRDETPEPMNPEASLARAVDMLQDAGFKCRSELLRAHPSTALLELAEREQVSMVVVGSRGLGRIHRLALGSVSDAVARYADAAFIGRKRPEREPT
ncbi:MAG: universal stress protein [Actinomycetota bacterium]|nr:universal stress protein [Actinomycetota bacterium]